MLLVKNVFKALQSGIRFMQNLTCAAACAGPGLGNLQRSKPTMLMVQDGTSYRLKTTLKRLRSSIRYSPGGVRLAAHHG